MAKINIYIRVLAFYSFLNLFVTPTLCSAEFKEQDRRRIISTQQEKAELFYALHKENEPLFLLNAWDGVSAKIFEEAGAKAIATTSAGIAAVNDS